MGARALNASTLRVPVRGTVWYKTAPRPPCASDTFGLFRGANASFHVRPAGLHGLTWIHTSGGHGVMAANTFYQATMRRSLHALEKSRYNKAFDPCCSFPEMLAPEPIGRIFARRLPYICGRLVNHPSRTSCSSLPSLSYD
jgi:hypothetical protein